MKVGAAVCTYQRERLLEKFTNMDLPDRLEIYIPLEAEVKSIALCSLPKSVLRRMDLPLSDSDGSSKLTDSPRGIRICPAVIRRKGQKMVSYSEKGVKQNMISLLDKESRHESGSYRMSFVTSNHTAYRVLKDTMPGSTVSTHMSALLHQGSSLQSCQDAVVIYNGQIYLSIRKPSRHQGHRETTSVPSTSHFAHKSLKKKNDKAKKNSVTQQEREVSSTKTVCSLPRSTDGVRDVDGRSQRDAGREQTSADAGTAFDAVANSASDGCEMQELSRVEAESSSQNDTKSNAQVGSDGVEQSDTHTWIGESLGASTSLQSNFDFDELEHDERIAQMKAKLRQSEAALSKMNSS